ncbi:hypothetical protein ES319_A09G128000v1 [Gossypium barbadense]|uniref:Secreted protein n=1 Tax=Gossypium barbadense TaxID=3634 RepID=A0A5J5UDZ5_GOSBA|nr:hypothetical protein ES319_A09G128000v1 [Gossypium barbadense]
MVLFFFLFFCFWFWYRPGQNGHITMCNALIYFGVFCMDAPLVKLACLVEYDFVYLAYIHQQFTKGLLSKINLNMNLSC